MVSRFESVSGPWLDRVHMGRSAAMGWKPVDHLVAGDLGCYVIFAAGPEARARCQAGNLPVQYTLVSN